MDGCAGAAAPSVLITRVLAKHRICLMNHIGWKINPLEVLFSWREGERGDSKAQADSTSPIMFTRSIGVSTEGRLLCAMHCPLEV